VDKAAFTILACRPGLKDTVDTTTEVTGGTVLDPKQQEALTSPGSIVEGGWCVCGVLLFEPASHAGKQQSVEQYLAEFLAA
jgi:hypothetical protein